MPVEHLDILIVGAGISGIGAAYYLQDRCPAQSYAILEGRSDLGGTWDLFRYPGVRSDSDMHTLGYSFKPWKGARAIAGGAEILDYLRETVREFGIDRHIRFHQRVRSAAWSSDRACWTVEVEVGEHREPVRYTCHFLFLCSGYYNYERGYMPDFPGREDFRGKLIHPQQWPADLDHGGLRVVVIGSGATAVTLVPSLAETAEHVTMLQRSPSYILSIPTDDLLARVIRRVLPGWAAHRLLRWKNLLVSLAFYQLCRRKPERAKRFLRRGLARELPSDVEIDTHFKPRYEPWDQRLCLVPDGDLFRAMRSGRASVVTDEVETFTERGILLESGRELPADVIVAATGLESPGLRRHPPGGRWSRHRGGAEPRLQGVDAPRRAQLRLLRRLYQRLMDVAGGAVGGVRLPAPAPHGPPRLQPVRTSLRSRVVSDPAAAPPELRLYPARGRPHPQTGFEPALGHAPELPARPAQPAPVRNRGRFLGILQGRHTWASWRDVEAGG